MKWGIIGNNIWLIYNIRAITNANLGYSFNNGIGTSTKVTFLGNANPIVAGFYGSYGQNFQCNATIGSCSILVEYYVPNWNNRNYVIMNFGEHY